MIAEDNRDRFPEGMRVLAVDDDPTCLKFLEALLRKCNYHVTVTNQAIKALEMLRENRNKYDLVISDVNMPDMDGFKLLELLGLEMDLPVIMLSGYSDVQLVMKGIDHGACDYMLKPVRLEELKNIWQHVVRKKKSSNQDKASNGTVEGGKRTSPTGCSDQNVNLHKKRKDQDRDEEEEEYSEEDDENEDSSSQKRRRVIWTGDLHRKFLAAVSQLKEEDVVPKKILDLMEVKEITRENVASHLQKYRQGLRKMKNDMVDSFGGNESSYLQSLRSGRMSSSTLSTYTSGGMFCGLNSPSGLSTVGMTSSSLGQPGYSQILSSYNNRFAKLQPITASPSQGAHLFQMTAALSKLNSLEQSKCISHSGKSYPDADLAKYRLLSTFRDAGVSSSSLPSGSKFPSNPLFLGIPQQKNSIGVFGNPTCVKVSSGIGISGSSNILDYNWPSENVQGAAQLSSFPISASATSHGQMNTSNMAACFNLPQIDNTLNGISSVSALSASVGESRGNVQNQEGLIGDVVPTLNYMPKKMWEEHKPGYNHEPNQPFSATSTPHFTSGIDGLVIPRVDQHDAACNYEKGPSFHDDRLNGANALFAQPSEASKFSTEKQVKPNEDYFLEQPNSPTGFLDNNHESFEDIMNTLTEREKNENVDSLLDAEFGFDAHSLGSFM